MLSFILGPEDPLARAFYYRSGWTKALSKHANLAIRLQAEGSVAQAHRELARAARCLTRVNEASRRMQAIMAQREKERGDHTEH